MEATMKNYQLAEQIIALFAKENCTVKQAEEILSFVGVTIRTSSTVQSSETLTDILNFAKDF